MVTIANLNTQTLPEFMTAWHMQCRESEQRQESDHDGALGPTLPVVTISAGA